MKRPIIYLNILLLTIFSPSVISCESALYKVPVISIPTAGNSWVVNEGIKNSKIITGTGISSWSDNTIRIRTYFRTEQVGTLNLSVRTKVSSGTSVIQVTVGSEKKTISLSNSVFDTLNIGSFRIVKPGYQWVEIQGISKKGSTFAEVSNFIISGTATEGKVYFANDDFYFGRRGPLENFIPETGYITRKGYYTNQWVMDSKGNWYELSEVKFTADATARKESRLDYSGGVENGAFFLRNCGFFSDKTNIDMLFSRSKTGNPPQINFSELE